MQRKVTHRNILKNKCLLGVLLVLSSTIMSGSAPSLQFQQSAMSASTSSLVIPVADTPPVLPSYWWSTEWQPELLLPLPPLDEEVYTSIPLVLPLLPSLPLLPPIPATSIPVTSTSSLSSTSAASRVRKRKRAVGSGTSSTADVMMAVSSAASSPALLASSAALLPRVTQAPLSKYKCLKCGQNCASNSALIIHTRVHTGERPFQCKVCCRGFSQNNNCIRHIQRYAADKLIKCPECHKKFKHDSNLTIHISSCKPLATAPSILAVPPTPSVRAIATNSPKAVVAAFMAAAAMAAAKATVETG